MSAARILNHITCLISIDRENAGSSKGGIDLTDDGVVDESTQNPKSSAFAALGVDLADVGMEDEEDFGGLMVRVRLTKS